MRPRGIADADGCGLVEAYKAKDEAYKAIIDQPNLKQNKLRSSHLLSPQDSKKALTRSFRWSDFCRRRTSGSIVIRRTDTDILQMLETPALNDEFEEESEEEQRSLVPGAPKKRSVCVIKSTAN